MLISCGDQTEETGASDFIPLTPPPEGEGFQVAMSAEAPPFSEVWVCNVYPIPIEEYMAINWVEYQQNTGTHHMTLSTPGFGVDHGIEYGQHDCADLYGNDSLMENQIMFFGSQGLDEDIMQLPEGVAANMPPSIDIIHELHYVNLTDETVPLYSILNAWAIPQDDVVSGIWGGQVRDETIEIPANTEHTEWSRCLMNEDVEVLFLASHTHALGIEFTVAPYDGKTVGDVIYENTDWHDPKITQYDPPLIVPAGQGFEWTCTWLNPSDEPVSYGSSSLEEMCNLAIVHMPFSMSAECEVVETSDGVLWDQSSDE